MLGLVEAGSLLLGGGAEHARGLEGKEETGRRKHSCICPSNIREEDIKESNSNQADKSGGAAYHAQLTFDYEARLSSASIVRLQAHKIECMLDRI